MNYTGAKRTGAVVTIHRKLKQTEMKKGIVCRTKTRQGTVLEILTFRPHFFSATGHKQFTSLNCAYTAHNQSVHMA